MGWVLSPTASGSDPPQPLHPRPGAYPALPCGEGDAACGGTPAWLLLRRAAPAGELSLPEARLARQLCWRSPLLGMLARAAHAAGQTFPLCGQALASHPGESPTANSSRVPQGCACLESMVATVRLTPASGSCTVPAEPRAAQCCRCPCFFHHQE